MLRLDFILRLSSLVYRDSVYKEIFYINSSYNNNSLKFLLIHIAWSNVTISFGDGLEITPLLLFECDLWTRQEEQVVQAARARQEGLEESSER